MLLLGANRLARTSLLMLSCTVMMTVSLFSYRHGTRTTANDSGRGRLVDVMRRGRFTSPVPLERPVDILRHLRFRLQKETCRCREHQFSHGESVQPDVRQC